MVDMFNARDSDSSANLREAAAVYDWLSLNKTFHAMRDAPGHMGHLILGRPTALYLHSTDIS